MSTLGVRTETPARLRGRRPRAPRAVPAVLVCLTLAACGGSGPAAQDPPAARASQQLLDALTPAHPFWGFRAAGRPALLPLADAVVGLRDSGRDVPGEAAGAVRSFWDPAIGLFADHRASVPPLASTWPAVRALTAEHLDAAHAGAIVEAVTARAGPGGIAWEPGGRPEPLASLYAARVLAALPGATAREALVTLAAALPCPRRAVAADAATALQARLLAGASCPVGRQLRARAERALLRAGTRLGRTTEPGLRALEQARALLVLEAAGALPRGSARELARATVATTGAGARARARSDSALALAGATAIRMRIDLARAAGLDPRLTAAERDALERTVRWKGALPDVLTSPDALETVIGAHALRATRPVELDRWVRWDARALRGSDRAVLALGLAPERLRSRDARAALRRALRSRSLRDLAVAALATRQAPATCAPARTPLAGAIEDVLARPELDAAPPTMLYWLALAAAGAEACAPAPARAALAAVRARLARLRGPDGLFGTARGRPADLLSSWAGLQAGCLAGTPVRAAPAAAARVGRTGSDSASPSLAFAAVRLPALAAGRCGGDWWSGALRPARP